VRAIIATVDPLVGRTVGGVRIDAKLGAGGMASVYAGSDQEAGGRRRAIKLLSVASHDHIQARFEREARIGHRLRDPLLVRVHRYGVSGDFHYMVMDLVEGEDLAHLLERTGPLRWAQAAAIGRDLARALAAVHELGMVHRDVKPQNILLDARGALKLADFGLALWRDGGKAELPGGLSLTRTGDAFGTPIYMAPEQFEDAKTVRPGADLYALGVVLFELVAGRAPFHATTPHDLARLHRDVQPPSLDALAGDAPDDLRALVARLLAKLPGERGGPAAKVGDELAAIAARGTAEPITLEVPPGSLASVWDPQAAPDERTEVPRRVRRRRARLVVFAGGLALLAGLAVAAFRAPWLRLQLADPEERSRYERVQSALVAVSEDPDELVRAIDDYLRDYGDDGLLREEVIDLSRTPVHLRENVYVVPRSGAEEPMVHVPGGTYTVGREGADGRTHSERRTVRLSGFLIDRGEVSNAAYEDFLAAWKAAGGGDPVHRCGNPSADHERPLDSERSPEPFGPVVGVTPWDAREFAEFYGRRLPSEDEWEVAASWDRKDGEPRPYPWGATEPNAEDDRYFANLWFAEWGEFSPDGEFVRQTTATGSFEFDDSPFGLIDAAGNASEWCAGRRPLPGKQPLRGGSIFTKTAEGALLTVRSEHDPTEPPPEVAGFRTVLPFEGSE